MVMSSGCYFGQNSDEINSFMPLYGDLHRHYVTNKVVKKEKIHIQPLGEFMAGYCEEGQVAIFFISSKLSELDDCRQIGSMLSKYVREEDNHLWLHKFV